MLKRLIPAILAVLIIPACGHDDDDDNTVTITNTGDGTAMVHIEHERAEWYGGGTEHEDDFELPSGLQQTLSYDWTHEVRVRIRRKSDGLLIFSEDYDPDDFDRHDQRIWIAVNP